MSVERDKRGGRPDAPSDDLQIHGEPDAVERTDRHEAVKWPDIPELDGDDLEPLSASDLGDPDLEPGTEHAFARPVSPVDSAVALAPVFVVPPAPAARPRPTPSPTPVSSQHSQSSVSQSRGSAPDAWIGKLIAGRYQIERELAAGGMGRVYVAMQQPLGRPVAIKVVRTEIHGSRQQFLRRFFLEAAACAKLTHPNIVTIHDYGETDDGEVFMAMEFLDGRSLDREIKDTAPMAAERALHIAIQVSRALREAHAKGIIHRDLKPQNVMLVEQGDERDFVKVLDFGLVKMLTNEPQPEGVELTRAGVLLGSPNYMSPEQILGGNLDGRTDIYSLGVVLFKMIAGKNPFARDAEMDVIYKHVHQAPPAFAEMGVTVPPATEAVVRRCLAKDPNQRFADCKDLVIALKDARREVLGQANKAKKRRPRPIEAESAEAPVVIIPPAPAPTPPTTAQPAPPIAPVAVEAPRVEEPRRSITPSSPPGARATAVNGIPARMYLRPRGGGAAIGPLALPQVELLYSTRILDDSTPISMDGLAFEEIARWGKLRDHLGDFRQKVVEGGRPWESKRTSVAPQADGARSVLAFLFRAAADQSTGSLLLGREGQRVRLSYIDGRIVEVFTDAPALILPRWLVDRGVLSQAALDDQLPIPPARSGDLGDALIAANLIPPHVFIEKMIQWAKWVVSSALELPAASATFEASPPEPPQIPLSFDKLGVLMEAVRLTPDEGIAVRTIDQHVARVAIPSSARGATVDDLKLAPRELRLVRGVDGTKTIGELVAAAKNDQGLVRRTLYLALEVGLLVLGEDQNINKDRVEAQRLTSLLAKLREKSPFDALNVPVTTNDEEVRARYMDMVKAYHPDHARPGCAPELQEAMRALFAFAQDTYAAIETADKREKYKVMRELGYSGKESEQDVVRRVLEAEIAFKKAKTFIKLKKFDEAVQMMRDAVAKKPKDVELKIHLRYYELLADKGDRAALAPATVEDILKLLKQTDGDIASAFLILGHLYKLLGQEEAAVKSFKKVLKFDERNHEAESELRLMHMREMKKQKKGLNIGGIFGSGPKDK